MTSRTFDVASYLRTRGSDSIAIQEIAATDFEEYREVNELILQGRKLGSEVLIAEAMDSKCYDTVVISKAADAMLAMSGIEASFVLAKKYTRIYLYPQLAVVVSWMYNGLWKSWEVEATLIWQQLKLRIQPCQKQVKKLTEIVLNEIKEKEKEEWK